MINQLYGFLADASTPGEFYYRHSDRSYEPDRIVRALMPPVGETAYTQYCADQLCQLCLAALPTELAALDPNNTYDRPAETVADPTTIFSGVPGNVSVSVFDTLPAYNWVRQSIAFSYDGVDTLTFAGYEVAWPAGGTQTFEYKNVRFRFIGTPAGSFNGTVNLLRQPVRDILATLNAVTALRLTDWTPTFEPYKESPIVTVRLAAHILNALERAND